MKLDSIHVLRNTETVDGLRCVNRIILRERWFSSLKYCFFSFHFGLGYCRECLVPTLSLLYQWIDEAIISITITLITCSALASGKRWSECENPYCDSYIDHRLTCPIPCVAQYAIKYESRQYTSIRLKQKMFT